MHLIQLDEILESLDTAINGRICTEAWLGYANVLFLGFDFAGEPVLLDSKSEHNAKRALYRLQTHYADWVIEGQAGIVGTADDERPKSEAAARLLLGVRAIGWSFIGHSFELEIRFEGGFKVSVTPMSDAERDISHEEAWNLRMPDEYYRHVRWDGTMFVLHKDEPCTNEPD